MQAKLFPKNDSKEITINYENGRKVKRQLKEHETQLGDRGIYNNKNKLNDLTGKEWTYFINSVNITDFENDEKEYALWKYLSDSIIQTKYSANGSDSVSHNLRKQHPSPKPPKLMADLISFFTKSDGKIFDPFMGVGGTLLGASLIAGDRTAIGVDLSKDYTTIYKQVCKKENLKEQITIVGDARDMDTFKELKGQRFDLILTDPPYANMLSKKRTGGDRKKDKTGTTTPFTEDKRDLGNIEYENFFPEFKSIMEKSIKYLKTKGYLVIFCKDLQPTKKHHNMLHADIVSEIIKIDGIQFKGYKIWYDKTINLYPYGYPFSFVANQLHQYILIFQKVD